MNAFIRGIKFCGFHPQKDGLYSHDDSFGMLSFLQHGALYKIASIRGDSAAFSKVACRQKGYSSGVVVKGPGILTPKLMEETFHDVITECFGNETVIWQCHSIVTVVKEHQQLSDVADEQMNYGQLDYIICSKDDIFSKSIDNLGTYFQMFRFSDVWVDIFKWKTDLHQT